jgi:hypothetical protein
MKSRIARWFPFAGGVLLACGSLAAAGLAADELPGVYKSNPSIHVYLAHHPDSGVLPPTALPQWTGSFSYGGSAYTYHMVGTAPSTGTSTTIKTVIIPLKITIGSSTFDAEQVLSNGRTVVQNTVLSPLFDSTTTYTSGGVDVGTTQYIDAFQRANFWGQVSANPGYHLLLGGPTVKVEHGLVPPASRSSIAAPFGLTVGLVDINWFDARLQSLIKKLKILPNTLPIFLIYDTYLTESGECCIGGYHDVTSSSRAYIAASYVDQPGDFSQDVSALSHEIGEWADDPLVGGYNETACGILEVGDPLETYPNYGGFPYTVNGFTYNLQDLVFLPYFGAPTSTSVNNQLTFQGESLSVCQNGQ